MAKKSIYFHFHLILSALWVTLSIKYSCQYVRTKKWYLCKKVPVVDFAKREFICLKVCFVNTMFLIFPQYFFLNLKKQKVIVQIFWAFRPFYLNLRRFLPDFSVNFKSNFSWSHLNQKPNEFFFDFCPKDRKWVK